MFTTLRFLLHFFLSRNAELTSSITKLRLTIVFSKISAMKWSIRTEFRNRIRLHQNQRCQIIQFIVKFKIYSSQSSQLCFFEWET